VQGGKGADVLMIKSLPHRFGKIGAPEAVNYFQKSQPLWLYQIDA